MVLPIESRGWWKPGGQAHTETHLGAAGRTESSKPDGNPPLTGLGYRIFPVPEVMSLFFRQLGWYRGPIYPPLVGAYFFIFFYIKNLGNIGSLRASCQG